MNDTKQLVQNNDDIEHYDSNQALISDSMSSGEEPIQARYLN